MKKLLIGAGVLVVLVLMIPQSEPPKPTGKKPPPGFASSKKNNNEVVIEEDYKIRFDSVQDNLRNSFVPILTKKSLNAPTSINGIPSSFTNGEATWIYTGNMTVDGVPNALLENTASGDGVFLRPGEKWRKLRLVKVNDLSIVLEGPNGATKTVFFVDPSTNNPDQGVSVPGPATLPPVGQPGNQNQFNNQTQPPFGGGGRRFSNMSGPIGPLNALSPDIEITEPSTQNNR
ncbi:MAG TPA: hypothetical protein VK171_04520 [Fimbriimonas sp.]|nr:hypothetical protein [Fimbriimonas sp.]